ncbi:hypothetical protein B0H15DRAFT_947938 [Mycena belliarum]|uniref:Uncharacterized protein n=1 Tax=Mycena belliarum TaxID=1033014 RepID=A0AAD6U666_9AGAR|nr:hypothetical protein B0H15DRAFT_947938 [Mycena belliae]
MPCSQLSEIWSTYITSPDPLSGMDSLYQACSTLTRHSLEPSNIILTGDGFSLHPDLARSLADVILTMDYLLSLAAQYHGLPSTPFIGTSELVILTTTIGLRVPATERQVVLAWFQLIPRLEAARCELKALCIGIPVSEGSPSKVLHGSALVRGYRDRVAPSGLRSKPCLRDQAVKASAVAASHQSPAPAHVKCKTVELGNLEDLCQQVVNPQRSTHTANNPASADGGDNPCLAPQHMSSSPLMPLAPVLVCDEGIVELGGQDKARPHTANPDLGEAHTLDEVSRASSERYPLNHTSRPASSPSSPPAAPTLVFDEGVVELRGQSDAAHAVDPRRMVEIGMPSNNLATDQSCPEVLKATVLTEEPKPVDAPEAGVDALDIARITPHPKSPAPAPAIADTVELGGLRVEVTQLRATASASTIKHGGLPSVPDDEWHTPAVPFTEVCPAMAVPPHNHAPSRDSSRDGRACIAPTDFRSMQYPAPALVRDESAVELGGRNETPQHTVIPDLSKAHTSSSEQCLPLRAACSVPSRPLHAPALVFDEKPVKSGGQRMSPLKAQYDLGASDQLRAQGNHLRPRTWSSQGAPLAADNAEEVARLENDLQELPTLAFERRIGRTYLQSNVLTTLSPPAPVAVCDKDPVEPGGRDKNLGEVCTLDGSPVPLLKIGALDVARVTPPPKSPAPAPAIADTVELGGLRFKVTQCQGTASASTGRDTQQGVEAPLAAAESSARRSEILQEALSNADHVLVRGVVTSPAPRTSTSLIPSFDTDIKVFALISAIIRTQWIPHLACTWREDRAPPIVWEREGIGTASRR